MADNFNFMWKLTENYFNLFIVLVGSFLIFYALVNNDLRFILVAVAWGLVCPFVATFIDKKTTLGKKK
jgi:hypothetical protein